MTKEYGQIKPEELSVVTVLDTRTVHSNGRNGEWKLKHHTAGFEPAGSVARYTEEKWSVTSFDAGLNSTFGNSGFRSEAEARKVFDSAKPWYVPKPTDKPEGVNGLRTRA